MIEFKTISAKNFLSVGNHPMEVDFQAQNTLLLTGFNGAGKSTIIEALVFGLYNKSLRKANKPQLINSINDKDCVVEVTFSTGGHDYRVRRGMKPNVFEIYEDGSLIEQSARNPDYQKFLENDILRIDFRTFIQVVILSTSNYTPFMQLTTGQRRSIIEDLLDINIFSEMNQVLKDHIRETESQYKEAVSELEIKKVRLDSLHQQIELIQNQSQNALNQLREKAKNIKDSLRENENRLSELNDKIHEKNNEYRETTQNLTNKELTETLYNDIQKKLRRMKKERDFFAQNSECPTCGQEIEEDLRERTINHDNCKISELDKGLQDLDERIANYKKHQETAREISKEIKNLQSEYEKINTEKGFLEKQIKDLKAEYKKQEESLQENAEKEIEEYKDLEAEYESLEQNKDELREERDYQQVAARLLRDDGIKATVIQKYLPLINQKILEYLDRFDFHVAFRLNEEFNEEILARYYDRFAYESFSAGERQRIDLALLFAWRDVARAKNSVATNLLFLDEILDSSCDRQAIDCLLSILEDFSNNGTRIVVISHHSADNFYDKFDSHMRIEKTSQGFTQIADQEKE